MFLVADVVVPGTFTVEVEPQLYTFIETVFPLCVYELKNSTWPGLTKISPGFALDKSTVPLSTTDK